MKFSDFLDVQVICETGSLRKAAAVLGITQPTLSTRIARLEDQLGAALFDRSHGRSRPTDLALFIARRAVALTDESNRLEREVRRLGSGRHGRVRIGLGPALMRAMVGGIVHAIHARTPGLSLELVSGPVDRLADELIRREIDLLVCEPLGVRHDAITAELMAESDIVAVARPEHPLCSEPPRDLAGLLKFPVATTLVRQAMLATLRTNYGIDLEAQRDRIVCADYDMLVRVVLASPALVSFGARLGFQPEIAAGTLAIIDTAIPLKNPFFMHSNSDAYPLPAVAVAQQVIRDLFVERRTAQA
ncbi:MAG: LysR family transcriptional regulator [Steroidobacteraceae bacterium]